MSLNLALSNALSGLRTNQQSISVLSNNIANVNTDGYSRQIVSQSEVIVEGVGSGVRIDDITRKVDKYLQRSVQAQSANSNAADTMDQYYQRVQQFLGTPGASNSLDTYTTNYFNAMQQLAESPDAASIKSNAVSAGATLAKQVSDLAANIYDLRFQADNDISQGVSVINGSLARLYEINATLGKAYALRQPMGGLLDARDKELATLSEYMSISTSYAASGAVSVTSGNGIALVEDGVHHALQYNKVPSIDTFVNDASLSALTVATLNDEGVQVGNPVTMFTAGQSSNVQSNISGGKLSALQQLRDVTLPNVLDGLDMFASRLRDQVNSLHNDGSGYPPASTLTGTREVKPGDQYEWSGTVRIAALQADGTPIPSAYSDESYTGLRPLTLDLGNLDSGSGNGQPTIQTIIDEINSHFGSPGNRVKLGNINNIQLASDTSQLPSGATPLFNFDLDLENISSDTAQVFVTGATVLDDTGTNITNVTQAAPSFTIQPTSSYTTVNGSADVTISLTSAPTNLAVGDKILLAAPSGPVNGITAAQLTGYFTVTGVSGSQVTFTSGGTATSSGAVSDAGSIQMTPPYDHVIPGAQERTRDQGQLQVDFSGNASSNYYDITLNVSVVDGSGNVSSAPVTYRVYNNQQDLYNRRYNATAAGGAATLVNPGTSQQYLRAIMVDSAGNELPTLNGKYVDGRGFLKLVAGNSGGSYSIVIDEMDSKQLGNPSATPSVEGTNWGFSHFFGLNDYFQANDPTATGDAVRNSAYNLKVEDRLVANTNLVTTGNLAKQEKSVASHNLDVYTYARYSGDNSSAQALSKLASQNVSFDAAGGLPNATFTLLAYTSNFLGLVSQQSAQAKEDATNAKTLYDGFKSKADAVSGVNLDEELANTVTLQNAYSANARVITTVNKMYDDLLQAF